MALFLSLRIKSAHFLLQIPFLYKIDAKLYISVAGASLSKPLTPLFLSSITSPAVSRPATPNRQIKCTPLGLGVLCLVSEPALTARVFQSSTWDSLLSFSLALVYRTIYIKSIDNVYILLVNLLCILYKDSPSPACSARAGCYCYTVLGNFSAVSTLLRRLRKIGHAIHAITVSSDSASPTR